MHGAPPTGAGKAGESHFRGLESNIGFAEKTGFAEKEVVPIAVREMPCTALTK
jgi:hypothetical protein